MKKMPQGPLCREVGVYLVVPRGFTTYALSLAFLLHSYLSVVAGGGDWERHLWILLHGAEAVGDECSGKK